MLRNFVIAALLAVFAAGTAGAANLTFWTTEEQPERMAVQRELAAAFKAKTGHTVDVVPVTESEMDTRATAAFAAGNLPDVIYHSVHLLPKWAEAGLLDIDAATEVVETLGPGTFAARPLEVAKVGDDQYAAVPLDGWTQLIVYRKDLFEANGLEPPNTYANIAKAIEVLHNPPEMYGFVSATKVDDLYMMQLIEHIFLANGYSPVGDDDDVKLREALALYKKTVEASPPGELYWAQSRELYFAGRAAMIVWSPFILDELAGLRDDSAPTINDDPTSLELAHKTGFVTRVAGPSNPTGAGYADLRYLSITTDADSDAAVEFVLFTMGEGYDYFLRVAPEGKFPVRRGTADDPEKFVKRWASLDVGKDRKAPLASLYPRDVIDDIVAGLPTANRWGMDNAEGQLRASKIVASMVISRIVRQYTDGAIDLDQAAAAIKRAVSRIK